MSKNKEEILQEYIDYRRVNDVKDEVIDNIDCAEGHNVSNFIYQVKELSNKISKGGKECKQLKLTA